MVVKKRRKTRKQRIRRMKVKRRPQHGVFLGMLAPILGSIAKPLLGGLFGGMGGGQQQQVRPPAPAPPPPPPTRYYYPPPEYNRRPPPRSYNFKEPRGGGPTRQRYV